MTAIDTSPPKSGQVPLVSVVMPAFNEERHIQRSLTALAGQTYPRDRFEVILVDNGSTDGTVTVARGFEDRLNLRVVSWSGGSIADVRNHGASLASGEVLAFLDSDCFTRPNWLQDAVRHGSPDLLWGAHYLVPDDGTWVGKIWGEFQAKEKQGPASFIPSSNLILHRSSFQTIGRFGGSFETSEDVELSLRARRHGLQIVAFPDLAVFHAGTPRTLKHFYLQNRWHGKHVVRMFLANLPRLTHLPLLSLSLYVLVMFWASWLGALLALVYHRMLLLVWPVVLLLMPALLLAMGKTVRQQRPRAMPRLFVLYVTYLLARAAALLQPPTRSHR